MEQVDTETSWQFDISPDTAVVTSTYITIEQRPILYVSHECDDEEGAIWQFHCGNGDYNSSVLQLVRLEEVLLIDRSIKELANLPIGHSAVRASATDAWVVQKEVVG